MHRKIASEESNKNQIRQLLTEPSLVTGHDCSHVPRNEIVGSDMFICLCNWLKNAFICLTIRASILYNLSVLQLDKNVCYIRVSCMFITLVGN